MLDENALKGKLDPAFAFDGLSAEFFIVSEIDFDVKPLAAFPTLMHLLSPRMLSPKVSPQLVQSHKNAPADWAAGRCAYRHVCV